MQGDTVKKVILNEGEQEFALGLLLVGATRTKSFEGLAFHSLHDFEQYAQIARKRSLTERLNEERRLKQLEEATIEKLTKFE